jgi:hypothetical protein
MRVFNCDENYLSAKCEIFDDHIISLSLSSLKYHFYMNIAFRIDQHYNQMMFLLWKTTMI